MYTTIELVSGVLRALSEELGKFDLNHFLDFDELGRFTAARVQVGRYLDPGGFSIEWVQRELEKLLNSVRADLKVPQPPESLPFPRMKDAKLRTILMEDLEESEKSLASGNWKAAMVLAGSILEAALYERLIQDMNWTTSSQRKSVQNFKPELDLAQNSTKPILGQMIEFACANDLLPQSLNEVLRTSVKDARNLIHPKRHLASDTEVSKESAELSWAAMKMALKEMK